MKTVSDSMGELQIPDDACYGAQTARAINNFRFQGPLVHSALIHSIVQIKRAAAQTNAELGVLAQDKARAIVEASHRVDGLRFSDAFPVSVYQTGSGTSSNMNVNEVLATLANENSKVKIHANDDVNCSQSSNDVFSTAIRVATSCKLEEWLHPALKQLIQQIERKRADIGQTVKTGRTHLMDALPLTFDQELSGWQVALQKASLALQDIQDDLYELPQGGTAVGTGVNCPDGFSSTFCRYLNEESNRTYRPAQNAFYGMAFQEDSARLAAGLKSLASIILKIADDLRWMNSGPMTGLSDIRLEALQPGSSIMPGKVNPVIPEAVIMACYSVMGLETTVSLAQRSSQFQLNVAMPLIGNSLLDMIAQLRDACTHLAENAIATFSVNEDELNRALSANPVLATALNTYIGYDQAAAIAKQAYREHRSILDVATEQLDMDIETLTTILDPRRMT